MTTKLELVNKSLEYHGSLDPEAPTQTCYLENGYMCAIGCQLKDPKKLEQYCESIHKYSLLSIIFDSTKQSLLEATYYEPLLVELFDNAELKEFAIFLQSLHDTSLNIKEYVGELIKIKEELIK